MFASLQCRSSRHSTTGPARAAWVPNAATAASVLKRAASGVRPESPEPGSPPTRRCRIAPASPSTTTMDAADRTRSRRPANGVLSSSALQCPWTHVTFARRACRRASESRRLFPIPASPTTKTVRPVLAERSSIASVIARSSFTRPTSGTWSARLCTCECDSRLDDLALALELEPPRRAPRHPVAELTPRFGADEHGSDVGLGLQPGGDVHGVAGGARLLVAPTPIWLITTSPVSMPTRTPKSSTPTAFATVSAWRSTTCWISRPASTARSGHACVRDRRAEERKDAIAGEVLHHAAKALDDLTELPNGTTDDLDDVFRVETRRQLC